MGGKDDYAGYAAGGSNVFRIPSNISVKLGLQWDFVGENPVDLDASCVAFDAEGMVVETIFFNNLTSASGYMLHTGDNQTGEDEGEDDESLIFHMSKIPPEVKYMMVCVTSYTGADFTYVERAHVRVVNLATKESVGGFHLGVVGRHTATLLCTFSRVPNESGEEDTSNAGWWDLREINIPCYGFTFCDVIPKMLDLLGVSREEHDAHLANLPDFSLEKKDPMWELVLSNVKFGLGWDGENDLDASMVMLDAEGKYVDHLHAKYGRLRCGGMTEQEKVAAGLTDGPNDKKTADVLAASAAAHAAASASASASAAAAAGGSTSVNSNKAAPTASAAAAAAAGGGGGGGRITATTETATSLTGTTSSASDSMTDESLLMNRVPVAEHSGDKLNGFDADGDDEHITVDLMRVDPRVHVVYFMVILYDGVAKHLSEVPKCYARFLNKKNSGTAKASGSFKEVDRLPITQLLDDETHTVLVPYAVYRKSFANWTLVSVSELMSGRDWVDVFPFLRAFTALGVSCEKWADWKRDIAPFAVRVTIREIRNLGPLEPHQFACRCMAWVQDRHGVGRFTTKKCKQKEEITFNESCTFFVDKLDVIRVLVFETAMVGHVDIPMAEFFPLSPPALSLQAMCYQPAQNNFQTYNTKENELQNVHSPQGVTAAVKKEAAAVAAAAFGEGGDGSIGGENSPASAAIAAGSVNNSPQAASLNNTTMLASPTSAAAASPTATGATASLNPALVSAAANGGGGNNNNNNLNNSKGGDQHGASTGFQGGRARPVMDGETMLDAWLPLTGIGVQGEVLLLLERVHLADAIREESKSRSLLHANQQEKDEDSGWSCSVM